MQFEISREDLIKLKHTSYEMYQFVISQKSADGDYCETLDIEKLKKECELGYFNVMDLFPKEKIISAYLEYVNPIGRFKPLELQGGVGLDQSNRPQSCIIGKAVNADVIESFVKWSEIVPDREIAGAYHIQKDPPKKHQALKDFLEDNHNKKAVRIKVFNQDMFIRAQEVLFGFGCEWAGENPADYKENIFIGLYKSFAKEIRYCDNSGLCFVKSEEFIDYCFKTEKFI